MAYYQAVAAVATTNPITISSPGGSANFDNVALTSGKSRVLLSGQSTKSQNGVWVWNGSTSALTRPPSGDPFATGATLDYAIAIPVMGGPGAGAVWGGSEWWLSGPVSPNTTST